MMLKNVKMPMTAGGGTSNRHSLKSALKRGFTIMELVIVIAVIAVLAAVLIPTFANITERANTSADTQTVKNLNTILISEETLGNKPATMAEALAVAESGGYKVENLTPTGDGNHIVWLKERNRFALLDENGELVYSDSSVTTLDGLTAYKMSSTLKDLGSDDSFAYCFTSETEVGDGAVEVSRSADFSLVEGITGITVNNDSAMEITAEGEDIAVTVNGTATLGIYGTVGSISGEDYGNESLHIYGTVTGKIELAAGRVVAMPGSDINTITVTATSADAVKIERQSGSAISAIGATNADVAGALDDVVTGDASDIDIPESAVSNDFAGGMGTEANPYLISTPAQLTKISVADGLYYKLINDIQIISELTDTANTLMYVAPKAGLAYNGTMLRTAAEVNDETATTIYIHDNLDEAKGFVLDGNGFTIYGPETSIEITHKSFGTNTLTKTKQYYVFANQLVNTTIKNITFHFTPTMTSIAGNVEGDCTFENVTIEGNTNWENNCGLFAVRVNCYNTFTSGTVVNITNCTNNANIVGTQYNALMFGYPNGKVTVNIDGFTNNGKYADKLAGIVFGNSSGNAEFGDNEFVININDFDNSNGSVTSYSSSYTNPYIASVANPEGYSTKLKLTVDGVPEVEGVISSKTEAVNALEELKAIEVTHCGNSNTSGLAIGVNENNTFTITPLNNADVDHYEVVLSIYATKTGGTLLYSITETLDSTQTTTTLKNLRIADDSLGYTESELINEYKTVINEGTQYYLYEDDTYEIGGDSKIGTLTVAVYAYGADGSLLGIAMLAE